MCESPVHPAMIPRETLLVDCDVRRLRRSGPGGQHRNKVETAVRLTHRPTGVAAMASERRSQRANLSCALTRLRLNLALEVRTDWPGVPTTLWASRCAGGKIRINPEHDDYPPLLAEALDALQAADWNMTEASASLGCTRTQLLKLLRGEPRALAAVNAHRSDLHQKPLR